MSRSYDAKTRHLPAGDQTVRSADAGPARQETDAYPRRGRAARAGTARNLPLELNGRRSDASGTIVLNLRKETETFVFTGIPEEPVPSLLRHFSAPVKVRLDLTDEELLFLMAYDSDEFNRWDAGQQLAVKLLLGLVKDRQQGRAARPRRRVHQRLRQDAGEQDGGQGLPGLCAFAPRGDLPGGLPARDRSDWPIHEARRFVMRTLAGGSEADLSCRLLHEPGYRARTASTRKRWAGGASRTPALPT